MHTTDTALLDEVTTALVALEKAEALMESALALSMSSEHIGNDPRRLAIARTEVQTGRLWLADVHRDLRDAADGGIH